MVYPWSMSLPERIADLTRELPAPRRGSLEAIHAALEAQGPAPADEPDWSPLDIEPVEMGDVELDR